MHAGIFEQVGLKEIQWQGTVKVDLGSCLGAGIIRRSVNCYRPEMTPRLPY